MCRVTCRFFYSLSLLKSCVTFTEVWVERQKTVCLMNWLPVNDDPIFDFLRRSRMIIWANQQPTDMRDARKMYVM
ncbi:hypothetical protein SAMN05421882_10552 [Nitrosomonas communis]|uniref:Uncharacterized protein n=1 Tax=Nitrosomonas communis TaxID=44574 RepID=A0A1H2YN74_9PROT|nr:hypothetical protein SAMN05421882_10552 [Nitrosomonas communis]